MIQVILILFILGFIVFCFTAGLAMFRAIAVRSSYTKKSPVDKGSHVKDMRIMEPLLAAKERWSERPLEKLTITAERSGLFKRFYGKRHSKIQLTGDLWLQDNFAQDKKIAILVHGFSDSAAGMAYLAEAYHEKGLSVLAINLRAHGDSGGRFAGLGYIHTDGADLAGWVDYVLQRFGQDTQIILHGISMGASAVMQCTFGLSVPVILAVADCGFSDFSHQMNRHVHFLFSRGFLQKGIVRSIVFFASLINFFVNGFFFLQNSPKKILRQASLNKEKSLAKKKEHVPLIIFHGLADTMTLPSGAKELFLVADEPKKLVLIDDAPHIGSWFYEKEKYMNVVFEYLLDS